MAEIGATLREARIRAKIDINEVETRTKIRAKYLRALENEEWDLLPGDVYVRSFLRTYGDYLGLDSRQLIDDFKRRYERPTDHELRPISPRSRDRDPGRERRGAGRRLPPWVAIGVVLVGVVVALYFIGRKPTSTTSTNNTVSTQARTRHHARTSRRRSVTVSAEKARARPHTVRLQLVATGAVYVCLVDGSGRALIPGVIFNAGQTIPVKTAPKMLLTLGNASVKMTVNGRVVPVAPSSSAIGYKLTPGAQSPLPGTQQPRCA